MEHHSQLEFTPHGVVVCRDAEAGFAPAFGRTESAGLLHLGGNAPEPSADASTLFWKNFADAFLRELCHLPDGEIDLRKLSQPDAASLGERVLNAPPMRGAEYLSPSTLLAVWERLLVETQPLLLEAGTLAGFLEKFAPAWAKVGRVTLHLAENAKDPDYPFAFLATYASGLSESGKLTQLPLRRALQEFSGSNHHAGLLKLLTPLHQAALSCPLIDELIESGDIYHPLAWTPAEAYEFLQSIPLFEDAGLQVRLPNWWKKRGRRPQVAATIGQKKSGGLGLDALLDFQLEVVVDGKKLTRREVEEILQGEDGLVLLRGEWIEVDRARLQEALEHWKAIESAGGISFVAGMRLLAGAPSDLQTEEEMEEKREWAFARPGAWLEETLRQLTSPEPLPPPPGLHATLRPYQCRGFHWLWFCARTGLGACLADDMGLGKTIQVLAALLQKKTDLPASLPSLLVVPASLIGNWQREADRFAPDLRLLIAHRSGTGEQALQAPPETELRKTDLIVTTYGMLTRLDWIASAEWGWIILDESQAIKNATSRQSKAVRKLRGQARFALTGTPVENNLGDLWALFDFLNPGLLGSSGQFGNFVKQLRGEEGSHFAPLRRLVAPYILRRLKTDRSIISDLPEKTEMKVFCGLHPAQAKLYQQTARSLQKALETARGMERRGLVLAYLMRFKQICNHPDHLTKAGDFAPSQSGKFGRMISLCEEVASRSEKALVFTQFREMTEPLEHCLSGVFGGRGLILHGGTPVKERQRMVELFQREDGPPFFVLSLKAGGTGLNLTAASHVLHFDRWWNPAVENQATDRAFRIGQLRNVLVHKFVTSGTLEEKIDALLTEKQGTADAILTGGAEKVLTEMDNRELLDFIRLDLSQAESLS